MMSLVENIKILTREKVKQTDLLTQQNTLMVAQNHYLRDLALATKRIDEFNRMAYQAGSGFQVPDDVSDKEAYNDFQETQGKQREAFDEMYHSDISLTGNEEE